ncbi:hypothetical protein [Phenylobacterium sp. J367]|uniref:hypothetical protein n=1 Tax=Phenylobacterium sp. J367 TaxID=2898435 RepID=UPI00215079B8|nr:hypothetical protein [Phenylobacterium sp. J367]MCR5878443.1 hypothetical protein [Phenylobacterium sp. J367]
MDAFETDLTCGERLVLCGLRLMAADAACTTLQPRFDEACGCAGGQALRGLEVFVQQLRRHGRRKIQVSPPAPGRPTADERLVLQVFASAQADDYRSVDAALAQLIDDEPPGALGAAACLVAEAFQMNGLVLPVRISSGSPGRRPAEPPPSAWPPRPPHGHARWPGRTSGAC